MASTTFSFNPEAEDSGSDHEHWPDDFKPAPAKEASPPPPAPEEEVKATVLTEIPVQYVCPAPITMSTHAYVPAPGGATITVAAPAPPPPSPPKPVKPAKATEPADPVSNTYTYHPNFSAKPVETTNKWQGRTKAEVEEDNLKIAADEKVWEKRKVVPVGLANDQMCWVVEADGQFTLR